MVHLNLHKTFSTPHGGGGPDRGPVGLLKAGTLLPCPLVQFDGDEYYLDRTDPCPSAGEILYGNLGILKGLCLYPEHGSSGASQGIGDGRIKC